MAEDNDADALADSGDFQGSHIPVVGALDSGEHPNRREDGLRRNGQSPARHVIKRDALNLAKRNGRIQPDINQMLASIRPVRAVVDVGDALESIGAPADRDVQIVLSAPEVIAASCDPHAERLNRTGTCDLAGGNAGQDQQEPRGSD